MDRKELDRTFNFLIQDTSKNQAITDPVAKALFAVAVAIRGMWPEEGSPLKAGDTKDIFCAECKEKTEHILILRDRGLIWKCTKCSRKTSLGIK